MNKIEYNTIDSTGRLLLKDNWCSYIDDDYHNGYRIIETTKGLNYIDVSGNILSDEYYPLVWDFKDGFGMVRNKHNKWNYIKPDGTLLSDEWFKSADDFKDGFGRVENKDGKIIYIDTKGELHIER